MKLSGLLARPGIQDPRKRRQQVPEQYPYEPEMVEAPPELPDLPSMDFQAPPVDLTPGLGRPVGPEAIESAPFRSLGQFRQWYTGQPTSVPTDVPPGDVLPPSPEWGKRTPSYSRLNPPPPKIQTLGGRPLGVMRQQPVQGAPPVGQGTQPLGRALPFTPGQPERFTANQQFAAGQQPSFFQQAQAQARTPRRPSVARPPGVMTNQPVAAPGTVPNTPIIEQQRFTLPKAMQRAHTSAQGGLGQGAAANQLLYESGLQESMKAPLPVPKRTWSDVGDDWTDMLQMGALNTISSLLPAPADREANRQAMRILPGSKGGAYVEPIITREQVEQKANEIQRGLSPAVRMRNAERERIVQAAPDTVLGQMAAYFAAISEDPRRAEEMVVSNIPNMLPTIGTSTIARLALLAKTAKAAQIAEKAATAGKTIGATMTAADAMKSSYDRSVQVLVARGIPEKDAQQQALRDSLLPGAIGAAMGVAGATTGLESAIAGQAARVGKGIAGQLDRIGQRVSGLADKVSPRIKRPLTEIGTEVAEEALPQVATSAQLGQPLTTDLGRTIAETAIATSPFAAASVFGKGREEAPAAPPAPGTTPSADVNQNPYERFRRQRAGAQVAGVDIGRPRRPRRPGAPPISPDEEGGIVPPPTPPAPPPGTPPVPPAPPAPPAAPTPTPPVTPEQAPVETPEETPEELTDEERELASMRERYEKARTGFQAGTRQILSEKLGPEYEVELAERIHQEIKQRKRAVEAAEREGRPVPKFKPLTGREPGLKVKSESEEQLVTGPRPGGFGRIAESMNKARNAALGKLTGAAGVSGQNLENVYEPVMGRIATEMADITGKPTTIREIEQAAADFDQEGNIWQQWFEKVGKPKYQLKKKEFEMLTDVAFGKGRNAVFFNAALQDYLGVDPDSPRANKDVMDVIRQQFASLLNLPTDKPGYQQVSLTTITPSMWRMWAIINGLDLERDFPGLFDDIELSIERERRRTDPSRNRAKDPSRANRDREYRPTGEEPPTGEGAPPSGEAPPSPSGPTVPSAPQAPQTPTAPPAASTTRGTTPASPTPSGGRVVNFQGEEITLTAEQAKAWDKADESYNLAKRRLGNARQRNDATEIANAERDLHGAGQRLSAERRRIADRLTPKERAAQPKFANGTRVWVNGQEGKVWQAVFGKYQVKLLDGTKITVFPAQMSTEPPAPESVQPPETPSSAEPPPSPPSTPATPASQTAKTPAEPTPPPVSTTARPAGKAGKPTVQRPSGGKTPGVTYTTQMIKEAGWRQADPNTWRRGENETISYDGTAFPSARFVYERGSVSSRHESLQDAFAEAFGGEVPSPAKTTSTTPTPAPTSEKTTSPTPSPAPAVSPAQGRTATYNGQKLTLTADEASELAAVEQTYRDDLERVSKMPVGNAAERALKSQKKAQAEADFNLERDDILRDALNRQQTAPTAEGRPVRPGTPSPPVASTKKTAPAAEAKPEAEPTIPSTTAPKQRKTKAEPLQKSQAAIRRGQIGDKFEAGEVVQTASGRNTTPFPKIAVDTDRKAAATSKRVDAWLRDNAIAEAKARGDEFNERSFSNSNPSRLSQSDKDGMEEYLFGEQPVVPPPFLKPLTSPAPVAPTSTETAPAAKKEELASTNRQFQIMNDIHDAALRIGRGYNLRVRLSDLRAALPQYSRQELDQALFEMQAPLAAIALMHLDDPLDVKDADRQAAIYRGGQTNEILYMSPDTPSKIASLKTTASAPSTSAPAAPTVSKGVDIVDAALDKISSLTPPMFEAWLGSQSVSDLKQLISKRDLDPKGKFRKETDPARLAGFIAKRMQEQRKVGGAFLNRESKEAAPVAEAEPVAAETAAKTTTEANKALWADVDAASNATDRKRIEADYPTEGKKAIFIENNINAILKEAEESGKVTKQCP